MKTLKTLTAAVILLSTSCILNAQPIDFTKILIGIDGKPALSIPNDPKSAPLTLSDVCVNALETPVQADQALTGLEKYKLDQLAHKIYNNKNADLTLEELILLKDRVGKVSTPFVVGIVWNILDPATKKEASATTGK